MQTDNGLSAEKSKARGTSLAERQAAMRDQAEKMRVELKAMREKAAEQKHVAENMKRKNGPIWSL
jgi:hypothetical protein